MSLFDDRRIQSLCIRLLDRHNDKGCSLESRHGRELKVLLQAVGGIKPVGRGAPYTLTENGHIFLAKQLAQTVPPEPDRGEQLKSLGLGFPSRFNQASFHALWYGDSKHRHSESPAEPLSTDWTLTQDEVIRIRTLEPLSLIDVHGQHHEMAALLALLGELALPERALASLRSVNWHGTQIITVENKGAFVDYRLQPGQLLLFTPGRNTTLAKLLIPRLPAAAEWAHFGDLDQRGIDIAAELARDLKRPAILWLPCDLQPYLDHYAHPVRNIALAAGKVPWRSTMRVDEQERVPISWLGELIKSGTWLEQEVLLLATSWRRWVLADLYEWGEPNNAFTRSHCQGYFGSIRLECSGQLNPDAWLGRSSAFAGGIPSLC